MENIDSLSNDLSFVILGSDSYSLPSEQNGERCQPSLSSAQNQSFDFNSALDVQEKLDQLLKENTDLKNVLNQNNLAMKTQFETLAEWQKEVLLTHQTHKQKFTETRDLVLKLRTENHLLKTDLEEKEKIMSTSLISQASHNSLESMREIEKLRTENFILVKDRDAFREECTRLNIKVSDLESKVRYKTEEFILLKNDYDSMSLLSETKRPNDIASSANMNTTSKLLNNSMAFGNDNCSLQSWACVQGKSDRETALLEEVETLKRLLHEEMSRSYTVGDVLKREEELKKELALKKNIEETMQEKLDEMIQLNREYTEKEKMLTSELQEEKSKNEELRTTAEKHLFLQTQVEAYETDFKEERAAREKLAGEKESLLKEIRELRRGLDVTQPDPIPVTSVLSTNEDCNAYVCFKCAKSFGHLTQLQNHVEDCLELQ